MRTHLFESMPSGPALLGMFLGLSVPACLDAFPVHPGFRNGGSLERSAAPDVDDRGLVLVLEQLAERVVATGVPKGATVAVFPFPERGGGPTLLGEYVADKLMVALSQNGLALVERTRLDTLRQEHRLASLGELDDATAANLGNLAGARFVLVGTLTDLGSTWDFTARLLGAQDGRIQAAHAARLPSGAMPGRLAGASAPSAAERLRGTDRRAGLGGASSGGRGGFRVLGFRRENDVPPHECPTPKRLRFWSCYEHTWQLFVREAGADGAWTELTSTGRLPPMTACGNSPLPALLVCAPHAQTTYDLIAVGYMADGDLLGHSRGSVRAGDAIGVGGDTRRGMPAELGGNR